jgi:hypothetical protein
MRQQRGHRRCRYRVGTADHPPQVIPRNTRRLAPSHTSLAEETTAGVPTRSRRLSHMQRRHHVSPDLQNSHGCKQEQQQR